MSKPRISKRAYNKIMQIIETSSHCCAECAKGDIREEIPKQIDVKGVSDK